MNKTIDIGILGATGMVGQNFIRFLQGHPWFRIAWLGASDRSVGKRYAEATTWRLEGEMPENVRDLIVQECAPSGMTPKLMFSSMDAGVATEIEKVFAASGHLVVSNSKNFRMEADVPLLIPEINADHLGLLPLQEKRGWKGRIVTNPNCATMVVAVALAPLKPWGIRRILTTTMQAVSGAGYPGVASLDILGNVIPHIGGEEEKMQQETHKILGTLTGGRVEPLAAPLSAHCNRVPVVDGHMATVSVELDKKATVGELIDAMRAFRGVPQERKLPSAPEQPLIYMNEPDRPQPRRDAERGNGMITFAGRLRECPVLGFKFVALSHNTIRGAAGAAVLNGELLASEGLLG
ncbi:MAG: aspartate-semialdehyde dehydrogenase [Bryobacteraceae bacterium]